MADELSIEQQKAIALAEAELSLQKSSWGDVAKNAVAKAVTGAADTVLNFPSNLKNVGKMVSELYVDPETGMSANMSGGEIPADYGQFSIPNDTVTDYATKEGVIQDLNMTPGQKIFDTAVQGGVYALASPAQGAKQILTNAALGFTSGGAGEAVSQATGSDAAGVIASLAVPGGAKASGKFDGLAAEEAARRQIRDKTLADARGLGYVTIPDNFMATIANRPKLLDEAVKINQDVTNDIARRSLGVDVKFGLDPKNLQKYRDDLYTQGYLPLKAMGKFNPDNDYFVDILDAYRKHNPGAASFPNVDKAKNDRLWEMADSYMTGKNGTSIRNIDVADIVEKIKYLRNNATRNIDSDNAEAHNLGLYEKDIANALEKMIERQASKGQWPPGVMEGYQAARRQIAISHTIEDALVKGTGNIDINKLARAHQRGDFMSGELEVAANFGNAIKGKTAIIDNSTKRGKETGPEGWSYAHLAGLGLGYKAATMAGLDPMPWGPIAALGGAKIAGMANEMSMAPALRARILSKEGQNALKEDYSSLGLSPYMLAPGALANLPEGE